MEQPVISAGLHVRAEMNMDLRGAGSGSFESRGVEVVFSTLITKSALTIHSSSTVHTSHPQPLDLWTV